MYRARDVRLERTVAIKILPADLSSSPNLKQRFEREARAISSLNHPHICALYDIGAQDGVDFLVMEYLDGQTLADRLQKGALPIEQVLKIGMEIADALDKAHRQGITHRDLKPGNIMLTKSGAKLMDFGLSRQKLQFTASATAPSRTSYCKRNNCRHFSIHIARATGRQRRRRAIRHFCVRCRTIRNGNRQARLQRKAPASIVAAILASEPTPINTRPTSPPELDRLIRTALAKNPNDRWQSAHDVSALGGIAPHREPK